MNIVRIDDVMLTVLKENYTCWRQKQYLARMRKRDMWEM